MERKPYITHCFAVVVCRNLEGRWLAVKETHNRGWWLPAGAVESGETFAQAAYRETLEVNFGPTYLLGSRNTDRIKRNSAYRALRVSEFHCQNAGYIFCNAGRSYSAAQNNSRQRIR